MSSSPTRGERFSVGTSIVLIASLVTVLTPVGFVELTPSWRATYFASLGLSLALGGLLSLGRRSSPRRVVILFSIVMLIAVSSLTSGVIGGIQFFAPLLAGFFAGPVLFRFGTRFMMAAFLLTCSAVALELLLGESVVSAWFGTQLRPPFADAEFRARGFVGQPIPTAVMAVALAAALSQMAVARRQIGVLAICASGCAIVFIATGSRSSILLFVVAVIIVGIGFIRAVGWDRSFSKLAVWLSFGSLIAALLAITVGPLLLQNRAFRFGELSGSESLTNRLYGDQIFKVWNATCEGPCKVSGRGPRSLQEFLSGYMGMGSLTTIDNIWLTVLWDFGLVGLLLLAALGVYSLRGAVLSQQLRVKAGATGAALILISGVFFDALYTPGVAALFGVWLGWMARADEPESLHGEREGRLPGRVTRSPV